MNVVLVLALVCSIEVFAQERTAPSATAVPQGTVIRWTEPGTKLCRMQKRSWRPIGESCYFPIDLQHKPSIVAIGRIRAAHHETARIKVEEFDYGTQEVDLPDIPQAHPSPADLRRDAHDRALLGRVFHRKESPPKFTLPLGLPAKPLPEGKSFGVKRIFNGKPANNLHTGTDYPVPANSPILAAADGVIVVARNMFFEGKAVLIDHGDGLITEYFHLSEIKVKVGQKVRMGHTIGLSGSTGRATGPHLFFGVRWHDARIDPKFVLEDPAKIPSLTEAQEREPARR